jgi:4-amino-4-deoxy-L-arabinose transferase-like glycosyltransferase
MNKAWMGTFGTHNQVPAVHNPSLASTLRSGRAPVKPLLDRWYDQAESGRATLILLGFYVMVWTMYQIISHASVDLHADHLEVFTWGKHLAAGNPKHPPLGALMSAAWFSLLPATDWAFYLLGIVNSAIALFAIDCIARRYLSGDKRLLALLLILLTPFYQFSAGRFGSNNTLLSTWPIATYCFLRAFETRSASWSAAAGLAAAAAMLGKYYSIYLVGGFVVAALLHPARWTYLKSSSPWISAACGLLALAPHFHWLMTTGFMPLEYAYAVHGSSGLGRVLVKLCIYLLEAPAYVVLPIAVYVLALRPDRAAWRAALWPADPDQRFLVTLLLAFLLLPAISAPFILLTPLWTMQSWFLLPIVLLAPERVLLHRPAARHVATAVIATTAAVLIVSPAVAWYYHRFESGNERAYYRAASSSVTDAWHETMGSQLRYVAGWVDFAAAGAFYSPDRPVAVAGSGLLTAPWVRGDELDRNGFAFVCVASHPICTAAIAECRIKYPLARCITIWLDNSYLGHVSASKQLWIMIIPPKAAAGSAGSPDP